MCLWLMRSIRVRDDLYCVWAYFEYLADFDIEIPDEEAETLTKDMYPESMLCVYPGAMNGSGGCKLCDKPRNIGKWGL